MIPIFFAVQVQEQKVLHGSCSMDRILSDPMIIRSGSRWLGEGVQKRPHNTEPEWKQTNIDIIYIYIYITYISIYISLFIYI